MDALIFRLARIYLPASLRHLAGAVTASVTATGEEDVDRIRGLVLAAVRGLKGVPR